MSQKCRGGGNHRDSVTQEGTGIHTWRFPWGKASPTFSSLWSLEPCWMEPGVASPLAALLIQRCVSLDFEA